MPLFFVLYYVSFRWAIVKFNIMTPGRAEKKEVKFADKAEIKARKEWEICFSRCRGR